MKAVDFSAIRFVGKALRVKDLDFGQIPCKSLNILPSIRSDTRSSM